MLLECAMPLISHLLSFSAHSAGSAPFHAASPSIPSDSKLSGSHGPRKLPTYGKTCLAHRNCRCRAYTPALIIDRSRPNRRSSTTRYIYILNSLFI